MKYNHVFVLCIAWAKRRAVTGCSEESARTATKDVTMNLCLGLEFAGAGLQFCGMMGATDHRKHCYTYFHKKAARMLRRVEPC